MHDVASQNPSHLVPGFRLDRYELLYPLAQGGMATVWVARLQGKHGFEKLVAIKTILPQYADDPEFQSMFLDEARLAARIRHPNVAEIMDLGEEEGTLFLVMEWVDGDSLAKLYNAVIRAQKRFPLPLIARIAADACAGLHAAHELHDDAGASLVVVHRDVSPQNILVSVGGTTKIIDFGVAKAAQRLTQETSAGLVKGKIQYASPEQATGRQVDRRSDIWAMGTVIYQLVTGRLPYDGENQLATLHMLTSGKPPRSLPPTVPKALQEVVKRALAFRPEDRFATALEMQRALEASVPPLATPAEVAALVQEFLGDRSEGRKRDVQGALAALSSRARIQVPPGDSSPRVVSAPGQATPAPTSGVNVRSSSPSYPKQTLMGMAPPPMPGGAFAPMAPPPIPPVRQSLSSYANPPAPPYPAAAHPPPVPPAPAPIPPAPSHPGVAGFGGSHPGVASFGPPLATPPAPPPAPPAWAAPEAVAAPPSPATHSPSGQPIPKVILAADATRGLSADAVLGNRTLRPIHMALGGSALVVMVGVWAAVAIVLLHAPREAPRASLDRGTSAAASVAPPVAATADRPAPPVETSPAASIAPPPSAPDPRPSAAAQTAPPAVTTTADAPPPATGVAPVPPRTAGTAAPAATPKGKKKKYDDGF